MTWSKAYKEFENSLGLAKQLILLDKSYSDPPSPSEVQIVQGLRGGAAILMVASFENFLNRLPEVHLDLLARNVTKLEFSKFPDKMRVQNIFQTLEYAIKGNPSESAKKDKVDRIPDIYNALNLISSKKINPKVFYETGRNPRPKVIGNMLNYIGISNIFELIKLEFTTKWVTPVHEMFIIDTLNSIVNRRNLVAHTSDALKITDNELEESIKFLELLAQLLDTTYKNQVNTLYLNALIP